MSVTRAASQARRRGCGTQGRDDAFVVTKGDEAVKGVWMPGEVAKLDRVADVEVAGGEVVKEKQ